MNKKTNRALPLTIITVCLNRENDIEKTCNSITSQSFKKFEWLVIDGGSTDKTITILNGYKKNIRKLISEKDGGIYDAMNKGIKLARGEYILFLNAGDYLHDTHVIKKIFFKKNISAVLYGDCITLEPMNQEKKYVYPSNLDKFYFIENGINHQSALIKRSLFEKYGLYNTRLKILADLEKWLRFLDGGEVFQKIPLTVAYYKNFDGLSSNKESSEVIQKERRYILYAFFTQKEREEFSLRKIKLLETELSEIKSTKFFKLWRRLSRLREIIFNIF